MTNRFEKSNSTTAAFINIYEGDTKVTDTAYLSSIADKIENGELKVECYLNKNGEPTLMIRL
jgi:hypothetical protein